MDKSLLSPSPKKMPQKGDDVILTEDIFFEKNGKHIHLGERTLYCSVDGYLSEPGWVKMVVKKSEGPNALPKGAIIKRPSTIWGTLQFHRTSENDNFKSGGHLEGVANGKKVQLDSAEKGGMSVGSKHTEGGIKGSVGTEGRPIEFEGEEIILTAPVANDDREYEFNGKKMKAREIASHLNVANGGVSFANGGEIKSCRCSGKEYKFGGSTKSDRDIIKFLNEECGCNHSHPHYEVLSQLNAGDITIQEALKQMASKN